MEQQRKQNLLNVDTWIRLLFMFLFGLLSAIARVVVFVVALLQFGFVLFTGNDNQKLRDIGQITAKWLLQAVNFLTFNSEQKPFPFDDWPELDAREETLQQEPLQQESLQPESATTAPAQETPVVNDPDNVPSFTDGGVETEASPEESNSAADDSDETPGDTSAEKTK